jgi:predicted ArsR family transcriptional regulator
MANMLISEHLCRVFTATAEMEWQTAKEIAAQAKVSERTGRKHLSQLLAWEIVEAQELSPSYRYRLRSKAPASARERIKEIQAATLATQQS